MSGLDRFLETFFNWPVIEEYLPAIGNGFIVTVELAILVVISGLALGFVLALIRAYRIWPINIPMVILTDMLRALPPQSSSCRSNTATRKPLSMSS